MRDSVRSTPRDRSRVALLPIDSPGLGGDGHEYLPAEGPMLRIEALDIELQPGGEHVSDDLLVDRTVRLLPAKHHQGPPEIVALHLSPVVPTILVGVCLQQLARTAQQLLTLDMRANNMLDIVPTTISSIFNREVVILLVAWPDS